MPGAGSPAGEAGEQQGEPVAATAEASATPGGGDDTAESAATSDTVTLEDSEQAAASAGAESAEAAAAEAAGGSTGGGTEQEVLEAGIEAMENASSMPPGSTGEGESGSAGSTLGGEGPAQADAASGPGSGEPGEAERLNAELNAALGRFDGAMLEERERIQTGSEKTGSGEAQAESVAMIDPEAGTGEAGGEGEYGSVLEGRRGGGGEATANDSSSGSGMSTASGGTGRKGDYEHTAAANTPPPDIPDGSDDDVVARQIREAAMKERDPELREKLWDEYRKYVNSAKGKS